jgi:hypothetical protein
LARIFLTTRKGKIPGAPRIARLLEVNLDLPRLGTIWLDWGRFIGDFVFHRRFVSAFRFPLSDL